jgi:hypothetical protein
MYFNLTASESSLKLNQSHFTGQWMTFCVFQKIIARTASSAGWGLVPPLEGPGGG